MRPFSTPLPRGTARALAAALVALTAPTAGCDGWYDAPREVVLGISAIDVPATVARDAAIVGTATAVSGGCRTFDRLDVTRRNGVVVLIARGRDASGPTVLCTADVRHTPAQFRIEPPHADPVRITALESDGAPVERVVRVE